MKSSTFAASVASLLTAAQAQQFVMYTGGDPIVERADPIINPGELSGHVHEIFGASNFAPLLDYDTLQNSSCTTISDSAGNGVAADKSVYWHPALYAQLKDGSGYVRIPVSTHKFYYKNAGKNNDGKNGQVKRDPFEFPKGFRMIAGNMQARAAQQPVARQNITQWICHMNGQKPNQGTDGGFPTGVGNCDAYPGLNGATHFPHCWNGEDFNQDAPTAHMAYPDGDIQEGACPSTHPIRLPHIFNENQFDQSSLYDQIVPDSYTLAHGDPTGYGWHFDFFNGWAEGALPTLFETSNQPYYGNEDIADGTKFKQLYQSSVTGSQCMSSQFKPATYPENVDRPGKNLPGCNPVVKTNPAPLNPVAPLGSNDCNGVAPPSSPSNGASSSSASAGSSGTSSPAGSGSTGSSSSSAAASSSTMANAGPGSGSGSGSASSQNGPPSGSSSGGRPNKDADKAHVGANAGSNTSPAQGAAPDTTPAPSAGATLNGYGDNNQPSEITSTDFANKVVVVTDVEYVTVTVYV